MKIFDPVRLQSARIAVIGDIMIDEYLTGEVNRISPEAPVPVVRRVESRSVPGGAANVLANIAAIGATGVLVGLVGAGGFDDIATLFHRPDWSVNLDHLIVDGSRRTTRKTRIISQRQQIIRLDYEDTHALTADMEERLIENAKTAIQLSDIAILSDYGKGALTDRLLSEVLHFAAKNDKFVIVDPKRPDFSSYRGASMLTPNRLELQRATGESVATDEECERAAEKAMRAFGGSVLLTKSEQGMTYYAIGDAPIHFPAVARQVFDVSGAGDTVVAILGLMLACGSDANNAIRVANHAAGIVVEKSGTATLTYGELISAMDDEGEAREPHGRLLGDRQAATWRNRWKEQGLTVGFANGCFDLLHPGHISLIKQAAAACDRLVIGLNSDASVRKLKGPQRPMQKELARAEVMGAIRGVSAIVLFDDETPLDLIKLLDPDILIKGADYTVENVVGADIVIARGGRVLLADLIAGQSTTNLIKAMK